MPRVVVDHTLGAGSPRQLPRLHAADVDGHLGIGKEARVAFEVGRVIVEAAQFEPRRAQGVVGSVHARDGRMRAVSRPDAIG
jgi:hypothetical protein